jgi:hypothetical protein
LAGGSGSTVMRAVSFFGPGDGSCLGAITDIAAVAGAVLGADIGVSGGAGAVAASARGDVGGKNGKGFGGGDAGGICAAGG